MKFLSIALFCQRNLRCSQLRSSIYSLCAQNIINYNYKMNHQSIVDLKFPSIMSARNCSSDTESKAIKLIPVVYYDEIKELPNHPEKILIDVREPNEIIETGTIPTSINIPLNDVTKSLTEISSEKFLELFGKKKPNKQDYIIFHCMTGKRSHRASKSSFDLGFENVKNYKGSWVDWESHGTP